MNILTPRLLFPLAVMFTGLLPGTIFAQTALPSNQNLPFQFAGRGVPQLLNGLNGFQFNLPANTVYAAVKLQTITPGVNIDLLVRRGRDVGGTANAPVFDQRTDNTNRNKYVQIGFDASLPIASDQPYFVAMRAAESTEPIVGVLRLEIRNMSPGGTLVEFSGLAQLYLAGQPEGTRGGNGDRFYVPLHSPPDAIAVTPGQGIQFQAVGTSPNSWGPPAGPEGNGFDDRVHSGEFGLSSNYGPPGGVIGVFLGPSITVTNRPLPIGALGVRDRLTLRPTVQQVFFIGSGFTVDGAAKTFVVPAGATRLFIGRSHPVANGIGRTLVRVEALPASAVPSIVPTNPARVQGSTLITLTGQPDGTQGSAAGSSPTHGPTQLAVNIIPGQTLTFRAAGRVSTGCHGSFQGPAGSSTNPCGTRGGSGISSFTAGVGALVGVFTGPALDRTLNPPNVDYFGPAGNVSPFRPMLQQVFLIGDGKLADGSDRKIIVPAGATRLFVAPALGNENETGSFTVSASAEVTGRPTYTKASIVNGASFTSGAVSVGSIVSIFGENLGRQSSAGNVPLPRSLGGTQVYFDTIAAPLYFVTPGQVNAQVPWELGAAPTALVTVVRDGVAGAAVEVNLESYRPGIFSAATIGAILVNSRTGALVTPQAPAKAGDVLIGYATGLGLVAANPITGEPDAGSPLATGATATAVVLTGPSGEREVTPGYAGLAPGFIGVVQVNFTVPTGLGSGTVKVRLQSVFGVSNTAEFTVAP